MSLTFLIGTSLRRTSFFPFTKLNVAATAAAILTVQSIQKRSLPDKGRHRQRQKPSDTLEDTTNYFVLNENEKGIQNERNNKQNIKRNDL